MTRGHRVLALSLLALSAASACRKKPEVAPPTPAPTPSPTCDQRCRDSIALADKRRADSVAAANAAREAAERERALATTKATLAAAVYFEYDSDELSGDARASLDAKLPILRANPGLAPPHRRQHGRARIGRVQPRPRPASRGVGQALPDRPGDRRRSARHRVVRRGAPGGHRVERGSVAHEPPRRVRDRGGRRRPGRAAMSGRRVGRAVATLSLVATSGCFATRSDMRVLQGDILNFRTESARADSARARQLAAVASALGTVGRFGACHERTARPLPGRHARRGASDPAAAAPDPGAHGAEPAAPAGDARRDGVAYAGAPRSRRRSRRSRAIP
jgi:hypothetical protein